MKKLSYCAPLLLAAALVTSCDKKDIPVPEEPKTVIELDGQKYETLLVATFQGEVGTEAKLTLGVYDRFDIYGVDFGDGVIVADTVCKQNTGLRDEEGKEVAGTTHKSATQFSGVVAGDGIVKVYGNSDLWYVIASGGILPTSFDQPGLSKVNTFNISQVTADDIDLTGLDSLSSFSFSQASLGSINVSNNANLKKLTINNNSASKFESVLKSIDVSQNTLLESINLMAANAEHAGLLEELDFSNNPNIKEIYAQNHQLKSVKLPAGCEISFLQLSNNQLEEVDLSHVASIKDIYLSNNKIKQLDFSKVKEKATINIDLNELSEITLPVSVKNIVANNNKLTSVSLTDVTSKCDLSNNQLTLATLPVKPASMNTTSKIKKFLYAPQAPLAVAEEVEELDLSAQLTAQGILEAPATTVYSFVTVSGTTLVEGTDYEAFAPGQFKFKKAQSEKVYGVMTNEALPLFTGDKAFKTTEFTVKAAQAEGPVFSWEAGVATGGTVVGNGADEGKVTESTITVSSKKANIATDNITITLDQALAAGDIIKITGYRKKDTDANGTLYFLFENGAVIDEGSEVKWNNIHESIGQEPNTNTYEVTDGAGSKTIKLARSKASTNVFITKIEIIRN